MKFVISIGFFFIIYGIISYIIEILSGGSLSEIYSLMIFCGIMFILLAKEIIILKNRATPSQSKDSNNNSNYSKLSYKNKNEDYSHYDVFKKK